MNCQFCGSEIPANSTKCPRCGANQDLDAALPPPSPYYNEVIPPTPPEVVVPDVVVTPPPPTPVTPLSFIPSATINTDRSIFALIAFILGIVGIPFAFLLWGCALPMNAIGIFLAWLGLKSNRRGMAIVAMVLNIGTFIAVIIVMVAFAGLMAFGIFKGN